MRKLLFLSLFIVFMATFILAVSCSDSDGEEAIHTSLLKHNNTNLKPYSVLLGYYLVGLFSLIIAIIAFLSSFNYFGSLFLAVSVISLCTLIYLWCPLR